MAAPDLFSATRPAQDAPALAHPFTHACSVCGAANAPFGEGVALRKGRPGTWFCWAHWPRREG